MIRTEDIRDKVRDIDDYLLEKYKENKKIEKRDWRTYEQQLMKRIKGAICNLEPLINEATNIEIHRGPGRPPELDLKQSVTILLIKELIGKSNRSMASMLDLISLLQESMSIIKKWRDYIRIMMYHWQFSIYTY